MHPRIPRLAGGGDIMKFDYDASAEAIVHGAWKKG
jgi:hypothetical protein